MSRGQEVFDEVEIAEITVGQEQVDPAAREVVPALHGLTVSVGAPQPLFTGEQVGTQLNPPLNGFTDLYDVGLDSQRFLVVQGLGQGASQMVLVEGPLLGSTGYDGK